MNDRLTAATFGAFSLASLLCGVQGTSDALNQRNAIREGVYAKAKTITPEVIRHAQELSGKVGDLKYMIAEVNFAIAGLAGVMAYSLARKKE